MKKILLIIGIIMIILIIGVIGVALFAKAPQVSVSGATIHSLNLSAIDLTIILTVDNPYPVAIPLKVIDYSVLYNGKVSQIRLATGELKGISIAPGVHEISIPVLVSNPAILQSLFNVLTTGKIDLSISGNITPDFFGIAPSIPFSKEVLTQVNAEDLLSGIGSEAGKMLIGKILG